MEIQETKGKEQECGFSELMEDIADLQALFITEVHGEETGKRKLPDMPS